MSTRLTFAFVSLLSLASAPSARAEDCRCLAIAGDVVGALQAEVARADGLYVKGDFGAALALYAQVYESAKVPALLYAQAMTAWQLGKAAEARALFQAYLGAGGALAYRARAEAALRDLGGTVPVVGGTVGAVGGVVGATGGLVGGLTGDAVGTVGGTVDGTVGAVGDVGAGLRARVEPKPKKLAHGAAVVLGVVAVAAIGAVGIHSIAAGLKDDIELDAKFDLGLGLSGVTVGITAIYLNGLTAATGVAAGGLRCDNVPARRRPIVAPVALPGGGGLVTAMSF
ncbi:MAG TPA: hypothetical protein VM513_06665 [Kofleriaceae bacterium]|jgi:hypothetical protein|nr:hypothetical protein [Kofleriaceae bacterium]